MDRHCERWMGIMHDKSCEKFKKLVKWILKQISDIWNKNFVWKTHIHMSISIINRYISIAWIKCEMRSTRILPCLAMGRLNTGCIGTFTSPHHLCALLVMWPEKVFSMVNRERAARLIHPRKILYVIIAHRHLKVIKGGNKYIDWY